MRSSFSNDRPPCRRARSRGEILAVSSLAIATVMVTGAIAAHAQSFQASGNVAGGDASIVAAGSTTQVTVRSPQAVINWTPFDGATASPTPINFQPSGTTATFQNDPSFTSDFAVLNRILPASSNRPIAFNGTVVSRLQDLASGTTTRGGTLFFYSPSGILVGSNAVFDVGNLVLTSSDIGYDPSTGAFGTGNTFAFQQANANSGVTIAAGAQITAGAETGTGNGYVALVAPVVSQDGAISVNGSAALVAADAATITFSPTGLFDIQVTSGTSGSGNVLTNTGSIGGPAGSSSTFIHRVYFVAVPKNDAITMAITSGSSLGFDVAGAADVEGNTVVLSAGYDVLNGSADGLASSGGGAGQASIQTGAIDATSAYRASATGTNSVYVNGGAAGNFASDLEVTGVFDGSTGNSNAAQVRAEGTGSTIAVGGNLMVRSVSHGQVFQTTGNDATRAVLEAASGGAVTVAGAAFIDANRSGYAIEQNAIGGSALVSAQNGNISIGNDLTVVASGQGSSNVGTGLQSGTGTGGTAQVYAEGGAINVDGTLTVNAFGFGGSGFEPGIIGGNGVGGFAQVAAVNGTVTAGVTSVAASGYGGDAPSGALGGQGTGGEAFVVAENSASGASSISLGSTLVTAFGVGGQGGNGFGGGDGGAGGSGMGGVVHVVGSAGNGVLTTADLTVYVNGYGGNGGNGSANDAGPGGRGGAAGAGAGGSYQIGTMSGVDTGTVNTGAASFGSVAASADGLGGTGGVGGMGLTSQAAGGDGGAARSGGGTLLVRGSPVTVDGAVSLSGSAYGGAGGAGGTIGNGGAATIGDDGTSTVFSGPAVLVTARYLNSSQRGSLGAGDITLNANAFGGAGATTGAAINLGNPLFFGVTNADITANSVTMLATASPDAAGAAPSLVDISGGTVNLAGHFYANTTGSLTVGLDAADLFAQTVDLYAGNWVLGSAPVTAAGTIHSGGYIFAQSGGDLLTFANFDAAGAFDVGAFGGGLRTGNIRAGGYAFGRAAGAVQLGTIDAGDYAEFLAGSGPLTTGAVTAGGAVDFEAAGAIGTGAILAGQTVDLDSGGGVSVAGTITAGDTLAISAGGGVNIGDVSVGLVNPSTSSDALYDIGIAGQGPLQLGNLAARGRVGIATLGSATAGAISGTDVAVLTGADSTLQSISGTGRVLLADVSMLLLGGSLTDINADPIFAAAPVRSSGGFAVAGAIQAGRLDVATARSFSSGAITTALDRLWVDAGMNVSTGSLTSASVVMLNAGGNIQALDVAAGDSIIATAGGGAAFGNLTALNSQGRGNIEVSSGTGNLVALNVRAVRDVALNAGANLTTGSVAARDMVLLAGGSVTTQQLGAGVVVDPQTGVLTSATGRVLIAGQALGSLGGAFGSYDYNAVFNAVPVRAGGAVTVGNVAASRFRSYSTGALSAQRVNAFAAIDVETGGLATIAQRWSAPTIDIRSNDIAIMPAVTNANGATTLAGLDAGVAGTITLVSLNSGQALIGDGLTGTGYALTNTEWGLIKSGSLNVLALDNPGTGPDMLIGKLAITGPDAGSTIDSPNGVVRFGTVNVASTTTSGTIRVTGEVTATGFRATNTLLFQAGRFELDAATGAVGIKGTGSAAAGTLQIEAANIHVASATLLSRLATDPFYAGHIADLNAPAAVQRTGPLLLAQALNLKPAQTVYIQNVGTTQTPVGFEASTISFDASGPVHVVINGRLQTASGLASGVDAIPAFKSVVSSLSFADGTSQLNGCLFSAASCAVSSPAETQAVGAISAQFGALGNNAISSAPAFGDTGSDAGGDDSGGGGKQGAGPIAPPVQLIDNRPLNSSLLIEEPVTGSGNPALITSEEDNRERQGEGQ